MAKGKYHEWLTPEGLTKIQGWAFDGLIDKQIAHNIGISEQTLNVWKNNYPSFIEALKKGKEIVDREVENSLNKRANGFTETINKVKVLSDGGIVKYEEDVYYPPDPTSMIFWLKNRKPSKWRDKPLETIIEDITQKLMENWKVNTTGNVEKELFNDVEKYDDDETDE